MAHMKYQFARNTRSFKKPIIILCLITFLFGVGFVTLKITTQNQEVVLVGNWQSSETGKIVCFTNENSICFDDRSPSGTYRIISPNTIEYTIENMTFKMIYRIEDKKLYWGLNEENLECFNKR